MPICESNAENPTGKGRSCVFCGEKETYSRFFPLGKNKTRLYCHCRVCGGIFCARDYLSSPAGEKERYLLHENSVCDEKYLGMLKGFVSRVLKTPGVNAFPGMRILDFGCGPSPVLAYLLREDGYAAYGTDPFFFPEGWPEYSRLEISPGSFDLVLCHECAEHFHFPGKTFSEMASFVKPEGFCAVSTRFIPPAGSSFPDFFEKWWYRMDFTHVAFYSYTAMEKAVSGTGLKAVFPVAGNDPGGEGECGDLMVFRKES